MKKLLILTLALLLMIPAFVACNSGAGTDDNGKEIPENITFEYLDISITLPGDFMEGTRQGIQCYSNDDYAIRCYAVAKSSITPNEGYEFPSLETFVTMSGILKAEDLSFKDNDGYLSLDYETTSDNISKIFAVDHDGDKQYMVFFETDKYFWFMSFYSTTVSYDEVKTQAAAWIDTIEISTGAAE